MCKKQQQQKQREEKQVLESQMMDLHTILIGGMPVPLACEDTPSVLGMPGPGGMQSNFANKTNAQ